MTEALPSTSLSLRSLVTAEGVLELSLAEDPIPTLTADQVLVRIDAAPINPSDLGLLLAGADVATASAAGTDERPVVTMQVPEAWMRSLTPRLGESMAVGNEGAGVVVAAGDGPQAQSLLGRTVAGAAGAMYSQYRVLDAASLLVLPEGTAPRVAASSFVNPLTALAMVETMRREGHTAIVHTAAASNLGQMLVRVCLEDDVPLVNIVRSPEQAQRLHSLGAVHVCDSSSASFMGDLVTAVTATSATLAFDAVGGGTLASQILTAMEVAASADATAYSRYGSTKHKQLYIYGGLDRGPTVLTRSFGFAWGIGGFLLTPFLMGLGAEGIGRLQKRVADGLSSTFASTYTAEVSLPEALSLAALGEYSRQATGTKYLITPHKDI